MNIFFTLSAIQLELNVNMRQHIDNNKFWFFFSPHLCDSNVYGLWSMVSINIYIKVVLFASSPCIYLDVNRVLYNIFRCSIDFSFGRSFSPIFNIHSFAYLRFLSIFAVCFATHTLSSHIELKWFFLPTCCRLVLHSKYNSKIVVNANYNESPSNEKKKYK